jgi:hypothetical protein
MKRPNVLIFIFVLILHASHALAQEYNAMGQGVGTCSVFAQHYKQNPDYWEVVYFAWAQGWMSGFNSGDPVKNQNLNSIPLEEQRRHLRQYCDQHPLDEYFSAVTSLYNRFKPMSMK